MNTFSREITLSLSFYFPSQLGSTLKRNLLLLLEQILSFLSRFHFGIVDSPIDGNKDTKIVSLEKQNVLQYMPVSRYILIFYAE